MRAVGNERPSRVGNAVEGRARSRRLTAAEYESALRDLLTLAAGGAIGHPAVLAADGGRHPA